LGQTYLAAVFFSSLIFYWN